MEEPGRVQSMGLQRVGHDWATSLSLSRNFNSTITQHTLFAMYSSRLLKARKMERDFHIWNHGSLEKFTKLHEILLTYTSPLCSALFQLVLQSWLIAMDPSWSKICLLFTESFQSYYLFTLEGKLRQWEQVGCEPVPTYIWVTEVRGPRSKESSWDRLVFPGERWLPSLSPPLQNNLSLSTRVNVQNCPSGPAAAATSIYGWIHQWLTNEGIMLRLILLF